MIAKAINWFLILAVLDLIAQWIMAIAAIVKK